MFISSTNALSLYNNHIDSNINFNIESPMSTISSSSSHMPTYMSLDDYTGTYIFFSIILK